MPFFSIVVPTYNASQFIKPTIESLLMQNFKDYEVIVVDDGSSDNTMQILESFGKAIRLYWQKHLTAVYARNYGIENAMGEYIVNFDHDDIMFPNALNVYYEVIRYFNRPPLIIGRQEYFKDIITAETKKWAPPQIDCVEFTDFFSKNLPIGITNSCIIAKKKIIKRVRGYQKDSFCFDDRTLLFMLGNESPMIYIKYPKTCGYRVHINSYSNDLNSITDAALSMIRREREGYFSGGKRKNVDRKGLIATNILSNIKRRFIFSNQYSNKGKLIMIFRILVAAREMLLFALYRKLKSRFYYRKMHTIDIQCNNLTHRV